LAYSSFTKTASAQKMNPPDALNMDAYWPVTRDTGSAMAVEDVGSYTKEVKKVAAQN
jgi:hypothetical protein